MGVLDNYGLAKSDQEIEAARLSAPPTIRVTLRAPTDADDGYIGATLSVPAQTGENWRRGRDLPDGRFDRETLDRVIAALIKEFEYYGKRFQ